MAKKKNRACFDFLGYRINIWVAKKGDVIRVSDVDKITFNTEQFLGQTYMSKNKDNTPEFGIIFNNDVPISVDVVAHECWHLFFYINGYWNLEQEEVYSSDELCGEAYAHMFEHLFRGTVDALLVLRDGSLEGIRGSAKDEDKK